MAKTERKYCRICEADTQHINGACTHCNERERREAIAAWQAKTQDEKLLDLHKRILALESNNNREFRKEYRKYLHVIPCNEDPGFDAKHKDKK